jgi:hypothetical protein
MHDLSAPMIRREQRIGLNPGKSLVSWFGMQIASIFACAAKARTCVNKETASAGVKYEK